MTAPRQTITDAGVLGADHLPAANHLVGDYVLVRPIGKGSYGEVWLGKNRVTGIWRAVKIIHRGSAGKTRAYERELAAIKKIELISRSHPGLVDVLHVGEIEDGFFYVMELGDDVQLGRNLDPEKYQPKTLQGMRSSVRETIQIGIGICEAVEALHGRGLLHRDIKPSNIIFIDGQPKLADVGLVASIGEACSFVGTEGFIPPEGPKGVQADIYALGKVLYEISTGRDRCEFPSLPPVTQEDHGAFLELNEVILRACESDPAVRFNSVAQLVKELHLLRSGKSISRIRHLERTILVGKRVGLAVLLVGALAGMLVYRRQQQALEVARGEERKVGAISARAAEFLLQGQHAQAVREFYQLYRQRPENPLHRLQLGATLAYTRRPIRSWKSAYKSSACSKDGKVFASSGTNTVDLFEPVSGEKIAQFPIESRTVALNYDGSLLGTTISNLGQIWRTTDGSKVAEYKVPDRTSHVAFGPKNEVGVCTAFGFYWRDQGAEIDWPLKSHAFRAEISNNGRYAGVSTFSGVGLVIDLKNPDQPPLVLQHDNLLYWVTFSDDSKRAMTTSLDRTARVWDLETGKQIGLPLQHQDGVCSILEYPRENLFVTTGLDRTLRIWSRDSFAPAPANPVMPSANRLTFLFALPGDQLLTQTDRGLNLIWPLKLPGVPFQSVPSPALPDKRKASARGFVAEAEQYRVVIKGRGTSVTVTLPEKIETIAWDPSAELLAVGTLQNDLRDHFVYLFKADGTDTGIRLPHRDGVTFVRFSHDGERIISCDEDFTTSIWDRKGRLVTRRMRHQNQVRWADLSADGELLATASWDGTVGLWETKTGDPVAPRFRLNQPLEYVSFAGGYSLVAAGKEEAFLINPPLFNPGNEQELEEFLKLSGLVDEFEQAGY